MRAANAASNCSGAGRRASLGREMEEWERAEPVSAWLVSRRTGELLPRRTGELASLAVEVPSAPELVLAALSSTPPSPDPDVHSQLLGLEGEAPGSDSGEDSPRVSPASYQNHWSRRLERDPGAGASLPAAAGWTPAEVASVLSLFAQCDSTARAVADTEQAPPEGPHSPSSEGDNTSPHRAGLVSDQPPHTSRRGDLAETHPHALAAALAALGGADETSAGVGGAGEAGCACGEVRYSRGPSREDAGVNGVCSPSSRSDLSVMSAAPTMTPSQSAACLAATPHPTPPSSAASAADSSPALPAEPAAPPARSGAPAASTSPPGDCIVGAYSAPNRACGVTGLAQGGTGPAQGGTGLAQGPAGWLPSRARPIPKAPLALSRRAALAYQARLEAGAARAELARAASERAARLMAMMAAPWAAAPLFTGVTAAGGERTAPVAGAGGGGRVAPVAGTSGGGRSALVAGAEDGEARRAADAAGAAMRAQLARNSGPRRSRVAAPGGMSRGGEAVSGARPRSGGGSAAPLGGLPGRVAWLGAGRPEDGAPSVMTAPRDPRCVDVIRRKASAPRLLG
jgi:hypothetical protein